MKTILPRSYGSLSQSQAAVVQEYAFARFTQPVRARAWLRSVSPAAALRQAAEFLDLPALLRSATKLSLPEQTRLLGISLYDLELRGSGTEFNACGSFFSKKEEAVATLICDTGAVAYFDEGRSIYALLQLACGFEMACILKEHRLDPLGYQWSFAFFSIIRTHFFGLTDSHPEFSSLREIRERLHTAATFPSMDEPEVLRKAAALFSSENQRTYYASIAKRVATVSHLLGTGLLCKLIDRYLATGHCPGWPDLTVIRGNSISFVEVKGKDKLLDTQIRWCEFIARPLNLDIAVIRVRPPVKGSIPTPVRKHEFLMRV